MLFVFIIPFAFTQWSHGIFDRDTTRAIALRWKPNAIPIDNFVLFDEDRMRRYTRAMIALNKETEAFGICASDGTSLALYILHPSSQGNGVQAILWGVNDASDHKDAIGELFTWHKNTLNVHLFPCASLEIKDQRLFLP